MESGMVCYHHPSHQAVAQCNKCGKGICKDCCETYGVTSGEYAGKALCYDCTSQLIESNIAEVNRFKAKAKRELIIIGIGAAIGGIIGVALGVSSGDISSEIIGFIFGILLGSSGLVVLKAFGRCISGGADLGVRGDFSGLGKIIGGMITLFISPIKTIIKVISRLSQMKKSDEIAASDSQTLEEIRAYFIYTQAIEKNAGVDLSKLATHDGELFENAFAKIVISKGEKIALEELRQHLAQIVANGETIRNFDPQEKPKNKNAT